MPLVSLSKQQVKSSLYGMCFIGNRCWHALHTGLKNTSAKLRLETS